MYNFNEHQKRIWSTMIQMTKDYLENKISFSYLVPSLEGLLDASEIKDKDLIKNWYTVWINLEVINAERELEVPDDKKINAVRKMQEFLEAFGKN